MLTHAIIMGLLEWFEDRQKAIGRNALTRVFHSHVDEGTCGDKLSVRRRGFRQASADFDAASSGGELDGDLRRRSR